MPNLDSLKEELSIHKQLFFMSIGVIIATVGWLIANLTTLSALVMVCGVVAILSCIVYCYLKRKTINRLLQEIKDD